MDGEKREEKCCSCQPLVAGLLKGQRAGKAALYMGSLTMSAIWPSQRRVWLLMSLYVFGDLGRLFWGPLCPHPPLWALPTMEMVLPASQLGVPGRSPVSQSTAHIHFAFSTSVTPYKSDTHKHKLITNGWSLLSNLKEARSNLNQDIKKFKCDTISFNSGITNGC